MADCSWLHEKLDDFRGDGKYCDVKIKIEETTFLCHRVTLASASLFFDKIFSNVFEESQTNIVTLHEVDIAAFQKILHFIYSGSKPEITESDFLDLLITSDYLGVPIFKEYCIRYICQNLPSVKSEDLFFIFTFACTTRAEKTILFPVLMNHMVKHFHSISQDSNFIELSFDELHLVMDEYCSRSFLSDSQHIGVFRNEDVVLDVLIRWVYHSPRERQKYVERLAQTVDFKRISIDFIKFISKEYDINFDVALYEHFDIKNLLAQSLIDCFTSTTRNIESSHKLPLPYGKLLPQRSLHVFIRSKGKKRNDYPDLKIFSVNKHKIDWFCSYTFSRVDSSSLSFKFQRIIATSEPSDCLYRLVSCELFDPVFEAYSSVQLSPSNSRTLTPPPFRTRSFEMCGMRNGGIYLYYTRFHNPYLTCNTTIENTNFMSEEVINRGVCHYDCHLNKWFSVPKMKIRMTNACVVADNNLFYIIGGRNSRNQIVDGYVQAYDNRTASWQKLSRTNYSYRRAVGCALNGKIYVSDSQHVEAYDVTAGKWEIVSTIPIVAQNRRYVKRMVAYENLIWIISCDRYSEHFYTTIVDPSKSSNAGNWLESSLLENKIIEESNLYDYEDDITENPQPSFCTRNSSSLCAGNFGVKDVVVFKSPEQ